MNENEILDIIKSHKTQYEELLKKMTKQNGDIKKGYMQDSIRLEIRIDTLQKIINYIK